MPEIKMTRQDLFPTRIWSCDLSALAPQFPAWIEAALALRAAEPEAAGRSLRQGWNSHKLVLQIEAFQNLRTALQECFRHIIQEAQLPGLKQFRLEAWINLQDQGGYNLLHVHPHALMCGAFYLQVPEGASPLVFRDPRPGVLLTHNSPPAHIIEPAAGQLVIFPNWLEHRVDPNTSAQPRISIGINAIAVA